VLPQAVDYRCSDFDDNTAAVDGGITTKQSRRTMKMRKCVVGLVVVTLSLGLFVGQAAAETATDTVDVYAGLAPVMELSCTDVNFGVWRVPTDSRSGNTTITLVKEGTASVTSGSSTNIALSGNWLAPQAGSCTVSGSGAANGITGQVGISSATGSFVGNSGSGFEAEAIAEAGTPVASFTYALTNTTPVAMAAGATSFTLHGTMEIPDGLIAANYGGYQSPSITVDYVDDDIGNLEEEAISF